MKVSWKHIGSLFVLSLITLWLVMGQLPTTASRAPGGRVPNQVAAPEIAGPLVSEPAVPQLSLPVRDLPVAEPEYILEREINPRHNPLTDFALDFGNISGPVDPLLQFTYPNNGRTPSPTLTFEGVDNFCGCSPPDTIGDVGPNHYVQMVNATKFSIFDKTGNLLTGPTDLNDLWTSGGCSTSDNGDPIVVYDGLADRWLLAQFSNGNGVCVAISQTADPTGAYYGYEFTTPSFPDYFKISVWPDAYYMSANESTYSALALNRTPMLSGLPATTVRFAGQTNLLLPADVDGSTPPPANTPGIFYTFKDNSFHGGADRLEIFELDVDWVTPGNSTFTLAQTLNITAYTYTVCGFFNFDCVPQAGTSQRVDAVSEWPMWRLAYRNFGSYETMLANFAIDVGADRSGIRWYELHRSGGTWSIYQEGTHAPNDGLHRFMGSMAMDGSGNIALAYSVSSSSQFPSIRYATRLASDPLGTLQEEAVLFAGSGSQTASSRWGDYSALSIDPADDCTFWATNEYYPSNSSNHWNTRVGAFVMPECQGGGAQADMSVSKTADSPTVTVGSLLTYTVIVTNDGPDAASAIVTDTLPTELTFDSATGGTCNESGGIVTCETATIANGDSATLYIVAQANQSGEPLNTVSVAPLDAIDPNPNNNNAEAPVSVLPGSHSLYLPIVVKVDVTITNEGITLANTYRTIAGVPTVTGDATLDDNCFQHARYMAENNIITHDQDPNLPFASPEGQICAENGNAWLGSEFFQPYWQVHHTIEGWMGSVPHRIWLLYPTTPTFGYGFYTAANNRAGAALDVLSEANFSADASYTGWPVRYPAPNQTDIPATAYPITLNWAYFGATPVLDSTSLTAQGGGPIAHTANTTLDVGHKGIQILPTNSLPANTTFDVTVTGTYDGTPFSYSWQFTTGDATIQPAGQVE